MKLFFIFFLFFAQLSFAETHIRLWRGFKQDDLTSAAFKQHLSETLVPATITVGKDKGLVSYMPVFLTALDSKPLFIPDEVAIIQYQDEGTYKTLAATPEFSAYGKMHYAPGAFVKKNEAGFISGSLVSSALTDTTSIDLSKAGAFHYGDVDPTWKTEQVQLSVVLLKETLDEKSVCLDKVLSNLKASAQASTNKGFVMIYDPQYLMIYSKGIFLAQMGDEASCGSEKLIYLKNQSGFDDETEGVNMAF